MALTTETGSPDPSTSTSSAEDSPASPSAWPVEDVDRPTSGGSGPRLPDAFAFYDPDGHCWKTSQGSLFSQWETYSETWPRSGMTLNGKAYPQRPLVRPTSDGESSSWPTPNAMDGDRPTETPAEWAERQRQKKAANPKLGGLHKPLTVAVQERAMWPTPTTPNGGRTIPKGATYGRNGLTAYKDGKKYQVDLAHVVKMWPTPTVQDASNDGGPSQFERNSVPLNAAVKMWTTPTADDTGHRKERYSQGGTALSLQAGGSLNPTWVEWLMGFPPGWTDCAA